MLVQSLPSFAVSQIRPVARPSAERFAVVERAPARPNSGPTSIAALASLQTLLAIQQVEQGGQEVRRRAVRRGRHLLDALEDVQLDLLAGTDPAHSLARLRSLAPDAAATDDPALNRIIQEIEVRAAVELAKQEVGR